MTRITWLLPVLITLFPGDALANKPLIKIKNYAASDADLIHHIFEDRRFAATSTCEPIELKRKFGKKKQTFVFTARCGMNPPSTGTCREFHVRVSGDVDRVNTYTAHVESVTLTTICNRG